MKPPHKDTEHAVIRGTLRTAIVGRLKDFEATPLYFRCYRCGKLRPAESMMTVGCDGTTNIACCRYCLSSAEVRFLEK